MKLSALLIGVERYGKDFRQLPAVKEDLRILRPALERHGVAVTTVDDHQMNAVTMRDQIKSFCAEADEDTVVLIYYSGHGINGNDGQDYVIPNDVGRQQAFENELDRVPTDLRKYLDDFRAPLVVFIVDACRDNPTKGAGPHWGEDLTDESDRFIRFLGCGPGQRCHILNDVHPQVSLFAKALAEVLETNDTLSLTDLETKTRAACSRLAPGLDQEPRLSGELPANISDVLKGPLFQSEEQPREHGWPTSPSGHDPSRFHYVVIRAESDGDQNHDLVNAVDDAIGREREEIWEHFAACWRDRTLVNGACRDLPTAPTPDHFVRHTLAIGRVFEGDRDFVTAIRAVVEADLAVFNLTAFEPGVMLLLGVRSAVRRGVTVCSYGAGWQPEDPLPETMPFNVQDISLTGHSPTARQTKRGDDPIDRMAARIRSGFADYALQPGYLDTPAHDALRNLGPGLEAGREFAASEKALLLCPFHDDFTESTLRTLRVGLERAFQNHKLPHTRVSRVLDLDSPRLVSQSIYENIRRTSACVVDWTGLSPSVFLELGARLAISELGAMHIENEDPGEMAKEAKVRAALKQVEHLRKRFSPFGYHSVKRRIDVDHVVEEFLRRDPSRDDQRPYRAVYDIVLDCIDRFHEATLRVDLELTRNADRLDSPHKKREGGPQMMFRSHHSVKVAAESAALDRRVAAWLYLEFRVRACKLPATDPDHLAYLRLGKLIKKGLLRTGETADREIVELVQRRLDEYAPLHQAKDLREDAEALLASGKKADREAALRKLTQAVNLVEPERARLAGLDPMSISSADRDLAKEAAETYGVAGGAHRRAGDFDEALEVYGHGAVLETRLKLSSTYNGLNHVKWSIRLGKSTLDALETEIGDILKQLLADTHEVTGSRRRDAWAWADLGDCHALLGNTNDARMAYGRFLQLAGPDDAGSPLGVLNEMLEKLPADGPAGRAITAVIKLLAPTT